jgi:hypothetical protein
MKSLKQWMQEKKTFHLPDEELLKQVQLDAYNSAVRNCWKNVTLSINGHKVGKSTETYSPSLGVRTISIHEESILSLIKDEQ